MTKKQTTKKSKNLKVGSVDDMLAESNGPLDIVANDPNEDAMEQLYGSLGVVTDEPKKLSTVRATRTFDQMIRGDIVVVDIDDQYWSDNLRGGNVEVIF